MFVSSRIRDGCFVCFAFSFSFLREQRCLLQESLKCILQLEEFKGMASCVYLCVRGKVCLCSLSMKPEVIAAMPVVSTCHTGAFQKLHWSWDTIREGFPELVLRGILKD